MSSEWREVILDDVTNLVSSKVKVSELSLENYISTENMLPNLGGVSVTSGLPTTEKTRGFLIDDVLFSNIRTYFKKVWSAKFSGGCSNDVLVFRAKEGLDKKFLYYVLADENFIEYSVKTSKGTKMPRGDKDALKQYGINLPPPAEQKAIANILGKLDDKIELNRQMNQTLEEMAQALFKSWFVDFDPVIDNALEAGNEIPEALAKKVEKRKAVQESGKQTLPEELKKLFPNKFIFNDTLNKWIPEGWEVKSLKNIVDISSSKRIFAKEYKEEGIPFYRGKEISLLSQGANVVSDIFITEERFQEIENKYGVPKEDDILLTSVGTIGNSYLVKKNERFYFKDGNLTWFSNYKTDIGGKYLKVWLESKEAEHAIENIKIGTTQQAITISSLNSINILQASSDVIEVFNQQVESFMIKSQSLIKQTETLTRLRDVLLPQLISGKLKVPEVMLELSEAGL